MVVIIRSSAWLRLLCLALVQVVCALRPANAQAPADAKGVVISSYHPQTLALAGQARAGRVFIEFERRGFFRIGVLPVVVAQDVQVQLQSLSGLTNVFDGFRLSHQRQRKLELRNLELTVFGDKHSRLHAATARLAADGAVELTGVSVHDPTGSEQSYPAARLHLTGAAAGTLYCVAAGGLKTLSVFNAQSDNSNKSP
jgi:hypothetical protein